MPKKIPVGKVEKSFLSWLGKIKEKLLPFHVKLFSLNITYPGGDTIYILVRQKEEFKHYFIKARFLAYLFLVLFGLVSFTFLGKNSSVDKNSWQGWEAPEQIGGFGKQKEAQRDHYMSEKSEFLGEEDEKLKDLLLGLSTEKKIGKKKEVSVKKIDYRVKPGDTLTKIAKEHRVTVESILGLSKLSDPNRLQIGQTLTIPTRDGFFYQIKRGDRLALILERHKVDWAKFIAENPDINLDILKVGDTIFLPGAKPLRRVLGWVIPVASRVITSGYGWRTWPQEAFHKGIDLKAYYAKVRAARGGVVTYAGWLGGYGQVVVIEHDGGYKTLYAHLSRIIVRPGQNVGMGQVIGISGNTGYSFGPHLHFEITRNGENINPTKIFSGLIKRKK